MSDSLLHCSHIPWHNLACSSSVIRFIARPQKSFHVFILPSLFLICICRGKWAVCSHSVKAESSFSKSYANTFNLFTEQTYIHKALSYTVDFYYNVEWK